MFALVKRVPPSVRLPTARLPVVVALPLMVVEPTERRPVLKVSVVLVAFDGNGYPVTVGVPVSWEYGSDRLGSVVIDAIDDVPARLVMKRVSNNPLNVVV
jgi:hypothetical protein